MVDLKTIRLGLIVISVFMTCFGCGDGDIERNIPNRFVGIGDSITAGALTSWASTEENYLEEAAYGHFLEPMLKEEFGEEADYINYFGGKTSYEGVERAKIALSEAKPEYLLVLYGTNDLHIRQNYPNEVTIANLREIILLAKKNETKVILGTLPPDGRNPGKVVRLNEKIRNLAIEEGVTLADHHPALSYPEHYADATHPNDDGCEIIAEVCFEAIKMSKSAIPVAHNEAR